MVRRFASFLILLALPTVFSTPIIDVAKTYSIPKVLEPNTKATVFVAITNPYNYTLSYVEVKFDSNERVKIVSDDEWDLGTIHPHEFRFVPLEVSIGNCRNSVQTVHAEIEYYSPFGYEDVDEYLPLIITSVPRLEIAKVYTIPDHPRTFDKAKLCITLANNGSSELKNINVVILGSRCLLVLSPNLRIINKLKPGETKTITYEIKTTNIPCQVPVRILYTDWAGNSYNVTESIGLDVSQSLGTVSIKNLTYENAIAGENNHVLLRIVNEGNREIKNIIVKIASDPRSPLSFSPQEFFIEKLNPYMYKTIDLSVYANPDAEGVYKTPILVRYSIDSGKFVNDSFVLTIKVSRKPSLLVYVSSIEKNQIDLAIANVGSVKARNVYVTLRDGNCYQVKEKSIEFIGDLDSGDYDTASFEVEPTASSCKLKGIVYYQDALGRNYTQGFEIPIKFPKEEATRSSSTLYIIGALLIFVGTIYYFLVKRKQNAECSSFFSI